MEKDFAVFLEKLKEEAGKSRFSFGVMEEGTVLSVGDGIAWVAGLRDARLYELIQFEGGDEGIVFDLDRKRIGVVLLAAQNGIRAGDRAYKTERIVSINVGESLLGRVLDALGNPIDGGRNPEGTGHHPVEKEAPPLIQRDFVSQPLYTGLKVIDAMLPLGRGQRELIIGDSSTGKTSVCVDSIINQKTSDVISVYVAIGQKTSHVLKVIDEIKTYGDFSRTIIVAADASSTFGLQYIAPYSATAMAEFFRDRGRDVLIVYDDLSKHAEAYRSLSLLLKRPPGREAYPGDIFFIHSRLLERSSKLHQRFGGGSITAFPIVETQQGRISSYIPTNLISITDGQIYLDPVLFNKGIRPAIDVGKSVSRIGGKAQVQSMKDLAEKLKIDYSRFLEVEAFAKFGVHLEEETVRLIRRGERLREILKQPRFYPSSLEDQVTSLIILNSGVLDAADITAVRDEYELILNRTRDAFPELMESIRQGERISGKDMGKLREFIIKAGN
jgi:F-type H+-transporting ATPase subunit alpha